ncbi:MAG TPA: hypothetical protein VFO35_12760, partial [Steroidobacteraceae bacterium]|nr:hypothetical protein [Steroidobacteraceae bacterium]
ALLQHLVQQPAAAPGRAPRGTRFDVDIARGQGAEGEARMKEMDEIGRRSVLTCPDCQGVMWEIEEGNLSRYRCHVGHTYSADLLNLALDESLRRALASAQRALEERVALAGRLHRQAENGGRGHMTGAWSARIREYEQELKVIRDAILQMEEIAAREELQRTRQNVG